jgi:hypothetical protein
MKYRMLTLEELAELEQELIQFLIVNGVDGSEWERLNKDDVNTAKKLVELFSDLVLEKAYGNMHFLSRKSNREFALFRIKEQEMDALIMRIKDETEKMSFMGYSVSWISDHLREIDCYKASKPMLLPRPSEIHQLLEQGCKPCMEDEWVAFEKWFRQADKSPLTE